MATVEDVARLALASVDTDAGFLLAVRWVNDRYMELCNLYPMTHLRASTTVTLTVDTVTYTMGTTDMHYWGSILYSNDGTATRVVHRVSLQELDEWYPARVVSSGSGGPYVYADTGYDSSGKRQFEVYPGPDTSSDTLTINYYQKPSTLSLTSNLPDTIDPHILRDGVLVDLYRYMFGKAQGEGNDAAAQRYLELADKQQGVWNATMQQAAMADHGRIHYRAPIKYPPP